MLTSYANGNEPGTFPDRYRANMNAEEKERAERVKRLQLEDGDYYFSSEGYIVFTEQYHLKRGYCCESGCRHCPYGYGKRRKE